MPRGFVQRCCVALLVLALSGCATVLDEDGALAIAPYKIQPDGQIVIETLVDGHGPLNFAIDTAASISVICDDVRTDLGLNVLPGPQITIQGMVSSGQFPLVDVASLAIGQETVVAPRVASLPRDTDAFRGIDGILGIDLLERYAIGFSTRSSVVRLYPPELVSERSYVGWRAIRLRPEYFGSSGAAVFVFDVEIRGRKVPALLDLGAGFNLISTTTARNLDFRPRRPPAAEEMSGAIESTRAAGRLRISKLSAGSVHWYNEEFTVLEVDLFDELKFGFSPRVILGSRMFTRRDFIIDFARNRLLVKTSMDST